MSGWTGDLSLFPIFKVLILLANIDNDLNNWLEHKGPNFDFGLLYCIHDAVLFALTHLWG